jgi:hypothetical protein
MFKKSIMGLLILCSANLFAQVQLRVTLKDGNVIMGSVSLPKVTLTTDFGKLDIPIKSVSAIKMGIKQDDGVVAKIVDVVEIEDVYSMPGQTNIKLLEVKTEYGTLTIPGDKMERIEVYTISDGQNMFRLQASKHISSNTSGGWLNTRIELKKGENFTISATGQVVFASLSGAKYTPDGKTVGAANTGEVADYSGGTGYDIYPTYGNVVFKIGEQGTATKAGNSYSGIAAETGILYLSIYEVVYNNQNTGSYSVKVEVK